MDVRRIGSGFGRAILLGAFLRGIVIGFCDCLAVRLARSLLVRLSGPYALNFRPCDFRYFQPVEVLTRHSVPPSIRKCCLISPISAFLISGLMRRFVLPSPNPGNE